MMIFANGGMDLEQISFYSEMLLNLNRIYTWIYDEQLQMLSTNCDFSDFGNQYFQNSAYQEMLKAALFSGEKPMILTDDLSFMWIVLPYRKENMSCLYLFGPLFSSDTSVANVIAESKKRNSTFPFANHLAEFIQKLPIIAMNNIFQYALMLYYVATGAVCQTSDIELLSVKTSDTPETAEYADTLASRSAEGNYAYEQFYLNLVEEGNLNYQSLLGNYEALGKIGTLAPGNPLRQTKNTCIATVALCSRAAIRGGLHPEIAYNLSNYYIQTIEKSRTISEIYAHHSAMLDDYIHRVHDAKASKDRYSKSVTNAISYIQLHLTDAITIQEIAGFLGYTDYYFSKRFRQETGISVREYIKNERMKYARLQLQTTDIEVAELSELLHFTSPSYFIKLFRENTGMTPGEFRKQYT